MSTISPFTSSSSCGSCPLREQQAVELGLLGSDAPRPAGLPFVNLALDRRHPRLQAGGRTLGRLAAPAQLAWRAHTVPAALVELHLLR